MKISNLADRRKVLVSRRNDESIVFERMLYTPDKDALLQYMISVCNRKYGEAIPLDGLSFNFDGGVLFTIQNIAKNIVIFIYGPNGIHPPEFHMYQGGRVRVKQYRFWEDRGLCRILPNIPIRAPPANVQTITRDAFFCIARYLGSRDLLSCRLVSKLWCRNASFDNLWNNRLLCPIPGYTGLSAFVRCAVLIQTYANVNFGDLGPIVLTNINNAWIHWHRNGHLRDRNISPGVIYEEEEGGKMRKVRTIANAKSWLVGVDKHHNTVRASKAACLYSEDGHYAGATCWITAKNHTLHISRLKGTRAYEKTIERLHDMMFEWIDWNFRK